MALPLTPIPAPPVEPPRLSLLRTFAPVEVPFPTVPDPTNPEAIRERESVGFTFEPETCPTSGVGNPDPCNEDNDKTLPEHSANVEAEPFYVWAGDDCASFGSRDRDWQGRARRQLAATLSYQVAHELWTGDQAVEQGSPNKYLASPDSDVVTDGATSPTDALARLEYAIGQCAKGQRGVIHATLHTVTFWVGLNLVRREGATLLTALDTIVVVDAGYDGSAPDGTPAADDSQWAYATGRPIIRVSPETVFPDTLGEALNRATNKIEYRVERQAAISWDGCCWLAAEMDLGWAAIGGAS